MDRSLSVSLHEGIKSLYQENILTDVIIQVEDQTFPCHRLILSAVSPYFRSMFTNEFKEKETGEVILQSVKPEVFKCILRYIYCSEDSVINEANVQEILTTASMLLIQNLMNICETFMSERISLTNAINVWRFAKALQCKTLARLSKHFILHEFESIATEDEYLSLATSDIIELIGDQSLNVVNEESVGNAVFRWLLADENTRKRNFFEVLQHVKLPLTRPGYVFSLTKRHPFLYENVELIQLLDETKLYHCQASNSNQYWSSKRFIYRNSNDSVNSFICITGNAVDAYSFQDKKWTSLCPLSSDLGSFWASCTHNNDLFISGGNNDPKGSLLRYDSVNNKWISMSDLGKTRFRHALVANAESLFLLGGTTIVKMFTTQFYTTDITEYRRKKNTYHHIGRLNVGIRSFNAVLIEQKIYTFGGNTRDGDDGSKLIQCFDLLNHQASIVDCELPLDATFTSSIVIDDVVYLMEGRGHLMTWANGVTKHIHGNLQTKHPQSRREGVSVCYFDGHLYVQSGSETIRVIEVESGKETPFTSSQQCLNKVPSIAGSLNLPKIYFQ